MTSQELAEIRRVITLAVDQGLVGVRKEVKDINEEVKEMNHSLSEAWGKIRNLEKVDRKHSSDKNKIREELETTHEHLEEEIRGSVARAEELAEKTFKIVDDLSKKINRGETPGDIKASEAKTAAVVAGEAAVAANSKASTIVLATNSIASNATAAAIDASLAKSEATTTKRVSASALAALLLVLAIQVVQYLSK